jgi:hypothetical protein
MTSLVVFDRNTQKQLLASFIVFHLYFQKIEKTLRNGHFGMPPSVNNDYRVEKERYIRRSRSPPRTSTSTTNEVPQVPPSADSAVDAVAVVLLETEKKSTRERVREIVTEMTRTYNFASDRILHSKVSIKDAYRSCASFLRNPTSDELIVSTTSLLALTTPVAMYVASHVVGSVITDSQIAFNTIVEQAGIDLPKLLTGRVIGVFNEVFDFNNLTQGSPEQRWIAVVEMILFAAQLSKMFGITPIIDELIVLIERDDFSVELIQSLLETKKNELYATLTTTVTNMSTTDVLKSSLRMTADVSLSMFGKIQLGVKALLGMSSVNDLKNGVITSLNHLGEAIMNNIPRPEPLQELKHCGLTDNILGVFTGQTCNQQHQLPLWASRLLPNSVLNNSHAATEIFNQAVYRNNRTISNFYTLLTGDVCATMYNISKEAIKPIETSAVGMGEIADVYELGLSITALWLIIGILVLIITFGYAYWKGAKTYNNVKHAEAYDPNAQATRIEELQFGKFFRL